MPDNKKIYMPQSGVPARRGITGFKGGENVVVVDRKTGEPIDMQPSKVIKASGRTKEPRMPKAAKPKAVITSQPDNAAEADGSGGVTVTNATTGGAMHRAVRAGSVK